MLGLALPAFCAVSFLAANGAIAAVPGLLSSNSTQVVALERAVLFTHALVWHNLIFTFLSSLGAAMRELRLRRLGAVTSAQARQRVGQGFCISVMPSFEETTDQKRLLRIVAAVLREGI